MDSVLHLIGIARKAGRLEIGEEPVGAAARARQARLILVAADAAENSARRAAHFAEAGKTCVLRLPYPKSVLGGMVGRASCAMLDCHRTPSRSPSPYLNPFPLSVEVSLTGCLLSAVSFQRPPAPRYTKE